MHVWKAIAQTRLESPVEQSTERKRPLNIRRDSCQIDVGSLVWQSSVCILEHRRHFTEKAIKKDSCKESDIGAMVLLLSRVTGEFGDS